MQAILHNIRSVHNVGSIFRTADGLGVEKLYLTGYTPKPIDRFGRKRNKFEKVALGAGDSVNWESQDNVISLIESRKKQGGLTVACESSESAQPLHELNTQSSDTCLVFGNEVDGLSENVIENCDEVIKIPMHGKKSSLNVSVAFGIICYNFIDR